MSAERRAERLFVALPSPVAAAKALKNATELAGMREAHLRDAVALAETFVWLEQQVWEGHCAVFSVQKRSRSVQGSCLGAQLSRCSFVCTLLLETKRQNSEHTVCEYHYKG